MDFIYLIINAFAFATAILYINWYLKHLFRKINNENFYNVIVKNKKTYILTTSDASNEFTNAFNLSSSKFDISGFDCEWAPEKLISLIQISFPDGCTFLIRIIDSKNHIPSEILNWLKDGSKLKFGVGVLEDARKLESQWQIDLRGSVDLRHLAVRVRLNGLKKMGLKSLANVWLNIVYPYEEDTPRLKSIQCSNWEQYELSEEQIEYACLDGIVGALCPVEFLCRKLGLNPSDALSQLSSLRSYCQGCIDLKFKNSNHVNGDVTDGHNGTNIFKKKNMRNLEKLFQRASLIYDNASILTPDGEMLSRLSKKKAEWYIRKNLGTIVSKEPFVVKLLFEPSGRASGENDYYVQEKENVCVVCGSDKSCVRKNIIPIEYRKHYPVSHKSHKSHDVLPLCVDCHRQSNILDDLKKKQLSVQYGAPLGPKECLDFNKTKVKNAARALRIQGNIPEARLKELRATVAAFFYGEDSDGSQELPESLLDEAASLETSHSNGGYVLHGLVVVRTLAGAADLVAFEVMWREHFLAQMQPAFLPTGWDTHHRAERYALIDPQ